MAQIRYPIGIQTFSKIIEEGWAYVDKTRFVPMLLKSQFIFLSRPRRFGKSLMLSTLEAYFEGRRELFNGLALESSDVDWTPSPVLHFDFNSGVYDIPEGLVTRLAASLEQLETKYGLPHGSSERAAISIRFEQLIRGVYEATGRQVVILIDEYDKPLLGLEQGSATFLSSQNLLKSFFGNLKSMDRYIRFAFITGVARFSKVSIFSDLNNLEDISLDDDYADICGLTENEVVGNFHSGIKILANKRGERYDDTLSVLRSYYDGYLFTPQGSRLYNPFSVLNALKKTSIEPYWFDTGTPTFLVRMIRANLIDPMDINGRIFTKNDLMQVRIGSKDPIPLMFQTGYLTINTYDPRRERYTLRFPNREVEKAFAEDLLPLYVKDVKDSSSVFSLFRFQDDLFDGMPDKFMKRLATLFKSMPYEDQCESVYRAVTYLLCKLCSLDARAEHHSHKGRSDLEVLTPDNVYIFEFKYNRSVAEAMDQIEARDYAGKYHLDTRRIYLIGVNYQNSGDERALEYEIKEMRRP